MRTRFNERLKSIARREAGAGLAEDVVQDALLIAVEQGRVDIDNAETQRWLCGVVRNRARMAARSARRSHSRDRLWQESRIAPATNPGPALAEILEGLSPSLRTFAALVLTGHNRREIAWLLRLPDTALRQRISALRRHLVARGLAAPGELTGLFLDLAYGRIRDALLPALLKHGGDFASHDPDGHLFLVRRSQNAAPRQ
jgi:DNA-directed RNA polymerase specialized sigma24 family protein